MRTNADSLLRDSSLPLTSLPTPPRRVERAKIALLAAAEDLRRREESASAATAAAQTMLASMERFRRWAAPPRATPGRMPCRPRAAAGVAWVTLAWAWPGLPSVALAWWPLLSVLGGSERCKRTDVNGRSDANLFRCRLEEEAAAAREQNHYALEEARAYLDEATRDAQARLCVWQEALAGGGFESLSSG